MDLRRFDRLARAVAGAASRRRVLATLLAGALRIAQATGETSAAPDPAPTCKPPGHRCQKKSDCCDQICKGKKRRKRCKQRTCQPGQSPAICGGTDLGCTTSAGRPGRCATTSDQQGYCANTVTCIACEADADCTNACGEDAACLDCAREQCGGERTRVCAGPGACAQP